MQNGGNKQFIGGKLRTERKLRHWSQVELARKVGVDTRTVQRWEAGETKPYGYSLQRLTQLFSVTSPTSRLFSSPDELGDDAPPTATLPPARIPLPPTGQLEREEQLRFLRSHVCEQACHVALYGLPGVGKTALVRAMVHDPAIRDHFSDGVLWACLGPQPKLTQHLKHWGHLLGLPPHTLTRSHKRVARTLRAAMGERKMLLVLDDAWHLEDAIALQIGGPNCVSIVTTRFPRLAARFSPTSRLIGELDEEASRKLLGSLAPLAVAQEPHLVDQLLTALGGLPLALTLAGDYLREHSFDANPRRISAAWDHVMQSRERLHLSKLCAAGEEHPTGLSQSRFSLYELIDAVVGRLLSDQQQRTLAALSVLPRAPANFSEQAALAVCDERQPDTLDALVEMGLLQCGEECRYQIHPVISDYARLRLSDDVAPLQRLVFYVIQVLLHSNPLLLHQESQTIQAAVESARVIGQEGLIIRALSAVIAALLCSPQDREDSETAGQRAINLLTQLTETRQA